MTREMMFGAALIISSNKLSTRFFSQRYFVMVSSVMTNEELIYIRFITQCSVIAFLLLIRSGNRNNFGAISDLSRLFLSNQRRNARCKQ
ncbi:uncharacterized protein LOC118450877 isoform X3 [Vespa mandarinia]|uniref:uncharacterized protein LOC118450877 isoform X3 n=1 Tax=Vespa mandarinia TaxID=7446 RepID=UPI00161E0C21|nr:uncharacterized protein LOC118450877 isoform X3 [Vespa mandarinia]